MSKNKLAFLYTTVNKKIDGCPTTCVYRRLTHTDQRLTYCKKLIYQKRARLESYLLRKYLLNLLNEPQQLAKIKTPKRLKIPNKWITNLRERKLKNNSVEQKEYAENIHGSVPMSWLEFFDVIGLLMKITRRV